MAARAATIDERVAARIVADSALTDPVLVEKRRDAWCRAASAGDEENFARRLARDSLTEADVMERLGGTEWPHDAPPPVWITDASWICDALTAMPRPEDEAIARCESDVPFAELLWVLIRFARERRDARVKASAIALFSARAIAELSGHLLQRVSGLCILPLYEVLSDARTTRQAACAAADGVYAAVIDSMRHGGWRRMFEARPVLLRLIVEMVRQWIETSAELMTRLADDQESLAEFIGSQHDLPQVLTLEGGLSDLHKNGRSVMVLTFADGPSVVYKPKSLAVDHAVENLVSWLNGQGAPAMLRSPRVIDRGAYGWAEWIAYRDVANEQAVRRFFQGAGAWTALFYVLAATDMHEENVIAAGEELVPIDLETCLLGAAADAPDAPPALAARREVERLLNDSVVTTGILPIASSEAAGAIAISGGLVPDASASGFEFTWLDMNTDAMRPQERPLEPKALRNVPQLGSAKVRLSDYHDEYFDGLRDYLAFLAERKDALLASGGPLSAFASVIVRRVIRPTRFYGYLMRRLADYRTMDDGAIWSASLDFVSRFTSDGGDGIPWAMSSAERKALAALNIPAPRRFKWVV